MLAKSGTKLDLSLQSLAQTLDTEYTLSHPKTFGKSMIVATNSAKNGP